MILSKPKTIYKCLRLKIYTGHSSYYVARKVHTAYMFRECLEVCQVSGLTADLWPNERSLVAQQMLPTGKDLLLSI